MIYPLCLSRHSASVLRLIVGLFPGQSTAEKPAHDYQDDCMHLIWLKLTFSFHTAASIHVMILFYHLLMSAKKTEDWEEVMNWLDLSFSLSTQLFSVWSFHTCNHTAAHLVLIGLDCTILHSPGKTKNIYPSTTGLIYWQHIPHSSDYTSRNKCSPLTIKCQQLILKHKLQVL